VPDRKKRSRAVAMYVTYIAVVSTEPTAGVAQGDIRIEGF
jgi:hypothetical protein